MGGNYSSGNEKLNQNNQNEKESEKFNNNDTNTNPNKDEMSQMNKLNIKFNLTIRIYSDEKLSKKYIDYLEFIKMEDWNIIYLDNGFSKENTNKLIKEYKNKYVNKKLFDEVLVIIIDSFESFINMAKNEDKNFLKDFNDNLFVEEQPFLLFLNKNDKDFSYISTEKMSLKDINYDEFKKECFDFILNQKEKYHIETYYNIEIKDHNIINTFLCLKKNNRDNFNVILRNNQEFIYSSQYAEEDDQKKIHDILYKDNSLILKNFDYNFIYNGEFAFLTELSNKGKLEFHFECYKSKFTQEFNDFLKNYKLLDNRNFYTENYYFNPFEYFLKFCSYFHENGDIFTNREFSPSKINIAVCGRSGAGKSTLLNIILNEKRFLEGQGRSISNFISSYSHPKYPINFIDFPGKNNNENLVHAIKAKISELNNIKEELHIILYCLKYGDRLFIDKEIDIISELINLNIKIIFVLTKSDKENTSQFKSFKNQYIEELANILKTKNIDFDKRDLIIVPIYSMKEKEIKPFGLDNLFNVIYDILKPKKIDNSILKKIKSREDEKSLNYMIKHSGNDSKKELLETIRNKIFNKITFIFTKFILTSSKYFSGNIKNYSYSNFTDLLYELSCIYFKIFDDEIVTKITNKIILEVQLFFVNLSKLGLSSIISIAGNAIAKIKNIICGEFEKEENINQNIRIYLYLYGISLNNGIEGIKKISEYFKNYYEEKLND